MARMLGKVAPSWCYVCHAPAGIDCPDRGRSTRQVKRRERDQVRRIRAHISCSHPHWDHEVAEDIDDMIDWWHETGGAPDGHSVKLWEYLGMTEEQYDAWLRDPTLR